jgi:hypothetical protein
MVTPNRSTNKDDGYANAFCSGIPTRDGALGWLEVQGRSVWPATPCDRRRDDDLPACTGHAVSSG